MENKSFDIHCIEDDVGRIAEFEEICPGVYYVAIAREDIPAPGQGEMFIVEESTPHLSDAAKRYGEPLPCHPEILRFITDTVENGYHIVAYEAYRYRFHNHLEVPRTVGSLHEIATYGREYYPEYFGDYPAPLQTPWGPTLRYKRLGPGVFAIETERCEKMVAVCYAIWASSGLSPSVVKHGYQTNYDRQHGIEETKGYLFYPDPLACIPLFELWKGGSELDEAIDDGTIDAAALLNAIWTHFPDYAAVYNAQEQAGQHNIPGVLLKILGADIDPNDLEIKKEFISMTPEAGTDYLHF